MIVWFDSVTDQEKEPFPFCKYRIMVEKEAAHCRQSLQLADPRLQMAPISTLPFSGGHRLEQERWGLGETSLLTHRSLSPDVNEEISGHFLRSLLAQSFGPPATERDAAATSSAFSAPSFGVTLACFNVETASFSKAVSAWFKKGSGAATRKAKGTGAPSGKEAEADKVSPPGGATSLSPKTSPFSSVVNTQPSQFQATMWKKERAAKRRMTGSPGAGLGRTKSSPLRSKEKVLLADMFLQVVWCVGFGRLLYGRERQVKAKQRVGLGRLGGVRAR